MKKTVLRFCFLILFFANSAGLVAAESVTKECPDAQRDKIRFLAPPDNHIRNNLIDNRNHPSPEMGNGKRYAVIVGISKYEYADGILLSELAFADRDAEDFANLLLRMGWDESRVKLITNGQATLRNIKIAMESWLAKAGSQDLIVLYWSGHGYPDTEDPTKVYFACYDTDVGIPATGYRMDHIRSSLEEKAAKNVIVLADTCHAGKLVTRGSREISIIPHLSKMSDQQGIPKGWIFMVSAESDRLAVEDNAWSNGAFTHCLLEGLSGKADGYVSSGASDGVVTMGELRSYLSNVMPAETQKVFGVAKRPVIVTNSGDPAIWNLSLQGR